MITVIASNEEPHEFPEAESFNCYIPDNASTSVAYIYKDKLMYPLNLIAFFTNPIAVIATPHE